jgi:hypothetical protein
MSTATAVAVEFLVPLLMGEEKVSQVGAPDPDDEDQYEDQDDLNSTYIRHFVANQLASVCEPLLCYSRAPYCGTLARSTVVLNCGPRAHCISNRPTTEPALCSVGYSQSVDSHWRRSRWGTPCSTHSRLAARSCW